MEKTVSSIVILLVWCVYAMLEGMREAYYYDAAMRSEKKYPDIHWIYATQRGLFLFIVAITMGSLTFPISLAFIFSYIHNGSYYCQRNDIDVRIYPRRFKDDSTTSTAFFELNYKTRTIMFYIGILFFIAYLFLVTI